MASPLTEPARRSILGPDPGRSIRMWVALMLRLGIGLSLLSLGLSGYYGMQSGGGPWNRGVGLSMLDPFLSGLPFLAIGLGLALILGFLTTAAAIGAGFFSLIIPLFSIIQIVSAGSVTGGFMNGRFGNGQFLEMMAMSSLSNLLTNAAMIWLSPLENNPFSVDALIFGRNEMAPLQPSPRPAPTTPKPMPREPPPIRFGE